MADCSPGKMDGVSSRVVDESTPKKLYPSQTAHMQSSALQPLQQAGKKFCPP